MRSFFILLFCAVGHFVLAESVLIDSIGHKTENGTEYIVHQVEDDETLYSLSRKYDVPIYEIIKHNPPTEFGLEKGQILRIPRLAKKEAKKEATLAIIRDEEPQVEQQTEAVAKPPMREERPPVEVKTNTEEVKHIVEEKQTLFSISRIYDVKVDEIKSWNGLTSNSLDIGQVLIIRKGKKQETTGISFSAKQHEVKPSETLFSISRMYNVTVTDIKNWNSLVSNEISIGQMLFVEKPVAADTAVVQKPKEESVNTNTPVKVTINEPKEEIESIDTTRYNVKPLPTPNFEEIIESGLAEQIEGSSNNRKYLALHKSAKIGTIIKVKNEMNDQEVFVRVIGPLPKTSVNDNMVIKISKTAYERLGAIDPRFRVTISYIP
ncbi:LysM peptidoglycan-binding domain-containing protein [Fulvivirga lutea]|uniref:LysM peptidoglycan-binding domain-containing protein n=1 Tax=Fulvivirga lutea TaxID=2810512 RepID=A0A974WIB2_9BACT|nr:LysM peptidoglycan-binding domain-containing protein [Fulvivirga lutea]QSE99073.1 LysM peptidoglycan-binding domain-containing protein [Fulvivirga lutea]